MKVSFLRAQRSQIATGFTWLTVAMHAVLVTLSIFIYSVFVTFSTLVNTIMPKTATDGSLPSVPAFGLFGQGAAYLSLLHFMVIAIVFILTIANALSIHFVNGGHTLKICFYLALTTAISGAVMIIVPRIVSLIFVPMVP